MKNVSVLTAAHAPNPEYLLESYASLNNQKVNWQWMIQVDGTTTTADAIPAEIQKDPRVDIGVNGEHLGVSATRNLGLLTCKYEFVQNLDSDDVLLPDALEVLADALSEDGVGFAFGKTYNRRQDGSLFHWQPAPYNYGFIKPGKIAETWVRTGKHHVTLAATMWRKTLLHAYGGWGAMKGREDLYLLLGVSPKHAAAYVDAFTLHYREHAGQSTKQSSLQGENDAKYQALCAYRLLAQRSLAGEALTSEDYFYIDELGTKILLPPPSKYS